MNIIVTGGSKGIGMQTAIHLAGNKNNNILITGRDARSLAQVAERAEYGNIKYFVADLSNLKETEEAFRSQVNCLFKTVNILINNAGSLHPVKFINTSEAEAREMMEVNFFAPAYLIRLVVPYMQKGSHIVNIASMGGVQGSSKFPGLAYYSASKGAMAILSECLAVEFKELGISINCLALGSVGTEMFDNAFPGFKAQTTSIEMGKFIGDFALTGNALFNGKIIPVALTAP